MFFHHSSGGDDTMLSCVKLTKSQEKKDVDMYARKWEELDAGLESPSAPGDRTSTSNGHILEDTVSPYKAGVPLWKTWKPFPENPPWTGVDFPITQGGHWGGCCSCGHQLRLKSSYTDMDLSNTWVSFL